MGWTNFHSHSTYSDGKESIRTCVETAVEERLNIFGISDHSPVPYDNVWSMKLNRLEDYVTEITAIKEEFKEKIEVLLGLEVDFTPDNPYCKKEFLDTFKFDYIIGSIHFVDNFNIGKPWNIDTDKDLFDKGLNEIFQNNGMHAAKRFYELTTQMIEEMDPDIIGHFDKIKMFNSGNKFFSERDENYRKMVLDVLDVIASKKKILELNTRGFYKKDVRQFYPSPWIIFEAKERNIPFMINSDCHHPDEMLKGYRIGAELLLDAGYKTLMVLSKGTWKEVPFNREGLVINGVEV